MRAIEPRVSCGQSRPLRSHCRGFTLVEVLAALLFMALVIPVAVDGLRVASRASVVGQRKAVAARIAQQVLSEQVIASQGGGAAMSGVTREANVDYAWMVRQDMWAQNQAQSMVLALQPMQVLTVQVSFPVQGQQYNVHLSTLVNVGSP
jgi:prepilin-type N-terminal cleavage/methylation domain-containing protein